MAVLIVDAQEFIDVLGLAKACFWKPIQMSTTITRLEFLIEIIKMFGFYNGDDPLSLYFVIL